MTDKIHVLLTVSEALPQRLDQFLADKQSSFSRACWQAWIKQGAVSVNQAVIQKTSFKLKIHDIIEAEIKLNQNRSDWEAQDLPLNVIYEDTHLLVIDKAANCVVHPAAGHEENTLVNALLNHCPQLNRLPRSGIIHRLDKDTTGLLLVPKTLQAHCHLTEQLQSRSMKREYRAIVFGEMISGGTINQAIGRHPKIRTKMAVVRNGKQAITHYRIRQRFKGFTELLVQLETGRTHQIRVHLSYQGSPIVGDPSYCQRPLWPKQITEIKKNAISVFKRQALHAFRLSFIHPSYNEPQCFVSEPPNDYQDLCALLND